MHLNEKPDGAGGTADRRAHSIHTSSPEFSERSTSAKAQRQRILRALRHRPQSTEDLRKLGIFQAPARIKELRDRHGYVIQTSRVTIVDREGYSHPRAALYVLHEQEAM